VTVRLFTGHGAGVYLLFAMLAFQVPRELSAPHADTVVVIANANNAKLSIFRILILLLILRGKFLSMPSVVTHQGRQSPRDGYGNAPWLKERIEDRQSAKGTKLITGHERSTRVLLDSIAKAFLTVHVPWRNLLPQ
jgi:hypothetical protein